MNMIVRAGVSEELLDTLSANLVSTDDSLSADIAQEDISLIGTLDNQVLGVSDVRVDDESVVQNNIAYLHIPLKVGELENDKKYVVESEAGNYIKVHADPNKVTIKLYTKLGSLLSSESFDRKLYYSGTAILINQETNEINVLYDDTLRTVNGKLSVNTATIATVAQLNEKLSTKQDKLTFGDTLTLDENNKLDTKFNISNSSFKF